MQNIIIPLQETINYLPDGVLIVSGRGRIEMVNTQIEHMFGYATGELTGQDLMALIPARFHHQHGDQVAGFFAHPEVRRMGEGRFLFGLRADGTEFDVEIALSPVEFNDTPMVIAVVRNVTKVKDLERALQWKNEQLGTISSELERFGFTISHDLKSPLANLHAIIHLLTRALPPEKREEMREHLSQLNHTLYAMSELISGVAAYSKATLADAAPDGEVDMTAVLAEVRLLLLKPPHITLEVDAALPPTRGNKTKLLQVFLNLISNAIKYNDKDHGGIRVSGETRGANVLYRVEDNGPGIAPELRAKVFTLFEKGASTRSDSQGIGLAIVHKVITELRGSINIGESALGGACFEITLPGLPKGGGER